MDLLRSNKDATATKLNLALFTEDAADNLELAARVARLEAEFAGVSLSSGRKEDALHALVAAAVAYRMTGAPFYARSCLARALVLGVGDAETLALLRTAHDDLTKSLTPAPVAKSKPEPKAEEAPEPKAEEAPEPKAEEAPEPKAEEAKEDSPKKSLRRKKRAPKSDPLP